MVNADLLLVRYEREGLANLLDRTSYSSGILNNIFTVIVLLHPRMRNSSTHVYLMALSACNIFLLAGLMINYSLKSIGKNSIPDASVELVC